MGVKCRYPGCGEDAIDPTYVAGIGNFCRECYDRHVAPLFEDTDQSRRSATVKMVTDAALCEELTRLKKIEEKYTTLLLKNKRRKKAFRQLQQSHNVLHAALTQQIHTTHKYYDELTKLKTK